MCGRTSSPAPPSWSWPEEGSLLSPLMGWSNTGDGFGYVVPLGFRKANPDGGRTWVSWLGYLRRTPGGAMDAWALFPLAFRNVTERNLFTPLFGWTSAKNGTPGITYLFPLGLRLADAEGSRLLTPLWFQKNTGGLLKWYGLMPLFFRDVARDRLFTPLFAFPVSYETTILLSAFGTLFGMFFLNRLPKFHNPLFKNERFKKSTDDRFFICIESADPKFGLEATRAFLTEKCHAAVVELVED